MCVKFVAIIKLGDRVKNNTEISRTTKGIKGKYQSETDRELKGKVVGSSTQQEYIFIKPVQEPLHFFS